ncbi:hypothetical protein N184_35240 [Sinorhizobium sp. GL28]|nr:hypothetical protein N184_35240 [Sinorhizobium sp. GL28]
MTRRPLHIGILFALLVLSFTAAFGVVAHAMADPAKPGGQIATAAVQHIETTAAASHRGSEDCGGGASSGDCCMPAAGMHCCGFGAIHAGEGIPAGAILLTHVKWHSPSEEPIAGRDPHGDLPPPRAFR